MVVEETGRSVILKNFPDGGRCQRRGEEVKNNKGFERVGDCF